MPMMKKIHNLNDLQYRKLYLRSELKVKEMKINRQLQELKDESNSLDIKNEVLKSMLNNPAIVFNTARITFDLFRRWRSRRSKRKSGRKKK